MSTSKPSRTLRKKGKTPESVNLSFINQRKLAYNILKNLEDDILGDKEIPELDQCSECNNEILTRPPKAFSILSCGHVFHRICVEKKLLLTMPNTCPFPDCGKNVDIIEEVPTTDQESPISALSNRMNETFILSSPILRMEGIENTGFQQARSYLKCAKCSEDLSSWLPPISSIRFPLQPQAPPKPLVYLTCKHIVHYTCIDNPRKLCPICPSTEEDADVDEDMNVDKDVNMDEDDDSDEDGDGDDDEEVETQPEIQSSSNSKKRANTSADKPSGKKSNKRIKGDDSTVLKRLIRELTSDTTRISEIKEKKGLRRESAREVEGARTFFDLYLKISNAEERSETARHEVILAYYNFGEELEKRLAHHRKTNEDHEAQKMVYDEIRNQLPKEVKKNTLRKKAERTRKVYDLFFRLSNDKIQRMTYIKRVKSFTANSISNLSEDNIKYVASEVRKNNS